ncbi:hypothetical protein SNE40_015116 [Patella caerulea]|uniref:Hexosyltransferase n=1 Tax=Patella caerulea TaxID=87958 RepID=A0AAN8PRJ5_PATCE
MLPRCSFVLRYVFVLVIFAAALLMLTLVNTAPPRKTDNLRLPIELELRSTKSMTTTLSINHGVHNVTESKVLVNQTHFNNHPFHYILNPTNICHGDNIYMLIYIHTAPVNFKKRVSIRETWGSQQFLNQFNSRLVFLMGRTIKKDTMLAITMESNQYGDIVQEDYIDSYRNLTHKANCALRWVTKYCSNAKLILKTDDDIMVNIYHLLKYIHEKLETKTQPIKNLLLCNKWKRMHVIREKRSKWYVSKEEFPYDFFPAYCSGSAFVMSADVVQKMELASRKMPFFWIDDYYLTGMVFNTLQIKHTEFNKAYILNQYVALNRYANDTAHSLVFYHTGKMSTFYALWKRIQLDHNKLLHNSKSTPVQHNTTY